MKRSVITMSLSVSLLMAGPVKKNELQIEVNGIVCNFCAYGIEKWVSKLPFVDVSKHGGDGVWVDIDTSFVNVALKPGKPIIFRDLQDAVDKAGYPAVGARIKVAGIVEKKGSGLLLRSSFNQQAFQLSGKDIGSLTGKSVEAELKIKKGDLAAHSGKAPVKTTVVSIKQVKR